MSSLHESLAALGRDEQCRQNIISALLSAEKRLARPDFDVRENITGPVVDALYEEGEVLHKRLRCGIDFQFIYRSKIARDFVMSEDPMPDHVWEPQTTKLLLYLASRVQHAAVAGAYCGDQAVLMAHAMQAGGGTCHCFEPNPDQIAMLQTNANLNQLSNMRFNQKCVWDKDGARLVLVGEDSFAHPETAQADGEGFETITLNTYGAGHGIEHLGLIMLDIEGAEFAALRGASRYLEQPVATAPVVVFEVHRSYVDWSEGLEQTDIGKLLISHGYTLYCVRDYQSNHPMSDRAIELVPVATAYLGGPPHGFNMLAVKDPAAILGDANLFRIVDRVSPKLLRHRDPKLHAPQP